MSASNASLNYNKTQALSLSGQPNPAWTSFLQDHGISSWHDKTACQPLTYLGYAICSSPQQRTTYATTLISMLRSVCQLHFTRSLTFRGRITVINSLLYSKLWHTIRLFTFSNSEIKQLQQLAASFINCNAKLTRFSFQHLTAPIVQGGLKLLDPALQANALQWRWLYPLLHPSQPSPPLMPSIPILRFLLDYTLSNNNYSSYHWSFLFSHCRPKVLRPFGPVRNLLRSVNSLQRNFHHCSASITTCLQLPLMELLVHQIPPPYRPDPNFIPPTTVLQHHHTIQQLTGSDVLRLNPETHTIDHHNYASTFTHRNSSRLALRLFASTRLLLTNFVTANFNNPTTDLDTQISNSSPSTLQSFLHSIIRPLPGSPPLPINISTISTKYFKALPSSSSFPTIPLILSSRKWKQFWKLQVPLNARNTWYRILLNKITTKQKLNIYMPSSLTDKCPLCPAPHHTETTEHFLFSCPLKHIIWTLALASYIDPHLKNCTYPQYTDLLHMTTIIKRTSTLHFPDLSVYQVFACIQQAIWRSHYRSVFDSVPFVPSQILSSIHIALHTLQCQETIHTLI